MTAADRRIGRVLDAMLAMQRLPWEQGVAAHALLDLGRDDPVRVIARDAVARQAADGRLADLGDGNPVNGAAAGEAVVARLADDPDGVWRPALDRQLDWLARAAPRAADGTLFHVAGTAQVWVDTVYMVTPLLALTGRLDEARRQVEGHRRRLFVPSRSLYGHIWDDGSGTWVRSVPWASGNGWVVAGLARALHHLRSAGDGPAPRSFRADAGPHVRAVADALLAYRSPRSGLLPDVLDDADSFDDATAALMLAYALFTGVGDGWLEPGYAGAAADLLGAATARVDADGVVTGVSGAPSFDRPGHSVEAQAFFLLASAAQAAAG